MDQFTAHLDRGWDLVSRGDFAGALISAQKSLELDAESPEAHNLLGFIHQAEGRAEDALEHYRQAIAIDETYVEAMLNAAEVLIHSLRDLDGGMAMVDEALDFAEGDDEIADALLLRFDAFIQQGERESAAQVAAKLPEGPFENTQLDFMVGRAKFETGDLEGAEKHLESAVKRAEVDAVTLDAQRAGGDPLAYRARADRVSENGECGAVGGEFRRVRVCAGWRGYGGDRKAGSGRWADGA